MPDSPPPYAVGYYQPPPNGQNFWALQFLAYVPYVGWLIASVAILALRSRASKSPAPIVRENARWSANWVLSSALYSLIIVFGLLVSFSIAPKTIIYGETVTESTAPMIVMVVAALALSLYWLVTVIIGCVKAKQEVHRPKLAIPFFRAKR